MGLIIGTLLSIVAIIVVTDLAAWYYHERIANWENEDKRHAAIAAIIALEIVMLFKIIIWSPAIQPA